VSTPGLGPILCRYPDRVPPAIPDPLRADLAHLLAEMLVAATLRAREVKATRTPPPTSTGVSPRGGAGTATKSISHTGLRAPGAHPEPPGHTDTQPQPSDHVLGHGEAP
jgi:hypothetical protein